MNWRKRLMLNDKIDVKVGESNKYQSSTIIEIRMNKEFNDKEFLVGFRVYCPEGDCEDLEGRRYFGLDEAMDEWIPMNSPKIERFG